MRDILRVKTPYLLIKPGTELKTPGIGTMAGEFTTYPKVRCYVRH